MPQDTVRLYYNITTGSNSIVVNAAAYTPEVLDDLAKIDEDHEAARDDLNEKFREASEAINEEINRLYKRRDQLQQLHRENENELATARLEARENVLHPETDDESDEDS